MFKKLLLSAAGSMIALSAFAFDLSDVQQIVPLKDGSAVYVFKDGKMGMEDKYGRATGMQPGEVMETTNGKKLTMVGNESARVSNIQLNRYPKD